MLPKLEMLAPLSDEQVVDRVITGDTPAFELLMRRHNQQLFRVARSVIGEDTEAEDIVQEAFVRAYIALPKFEKRSSFSTWMTRITFHEALRRHRKQRRDLLRHHGDLGHLASEQNDLQGSNNLQRTEGYKVLTKAFDSLPTSQRAVVMLRLIQELSTKETAESLRISESSVKVNLHRAKKALADKLDECAVSGLRDHFSFAQDRCDRVVARVFVRLESMQQDDEPTNGFM